METNSETNSNKSTVSTPVRPSTPHTSGIRKQVGFSRPTLLIPTPQTRSANPTINGPTPMVYDRKASAFVFEQFNELKDFTKSGLGIGEKSAYWLYSKLRLWSRKWFTHLFLTIVLVIYTVGGALMFQKFEGENESIPDSDLRIAKKALIDYFTEKAKEPLLDIEQDDSTIEAILTYESNVINNIKKTALFQKYNDEGKTWTLMNAIIYCGSVYTSIGYGHIFPQTFKGRVLTIVYSLIGMPLFLIILTDFGKLFTRCIKYVWAYVRRLCHTGNCRRIKKNTEVEDLFKGAQFMYEIATFRKPSIFANPDPAQQETVTIGTSTPTTPAISNFEIDDEFNLPISLAIFIMLIYIFLGATIYCVWLEWPFFDAFYFVFISMSTVGFGDMVPGNPVCMIVTMVYLVFGLALTSMCINVVQGKLSVTFKQAQSKIGATMGIEVQDDGMVVTVPPEAVEIPPVHGTKIEGKTAKNGHVDN